MSKFNDERGSELRELFFESAQELLQSLNEGALQLEKTPDDAEAVRGVRRIVHTLKGDAAACGYRELSELAHEMEDALAVEAAAAHSSLADVTFAAADLFSVMLSAYRKEKKLPDTAGLRAMIRKLAALPSKAKTKTTRAAAKLPSGQWTEYERLSIETALAQGRSVLHVTVTLDPQCAMPIAGRQLVYVALKPLGDVLAQYPAANSNKAGRVLEFAIATVRSAAEVAAKVKIPTIVLKSKAVALSASANRKIRTKGQTRATLDPASPSVEPVKQTEAAAPSMLAPDAGTVALPQPENILRVDSERIDSVLNLVGELIIGKSMLQQALNEVAANDPRHVLRGKFADAMAFQARVLNDLQRSVMKIRMVPVEQLFRRFPRIVRDVARQCGKDVDLVLGGETTDLDKSILDTIAEPLTHLVRNAVGHGIESGAQRTASGKPARGTVRLNAYHQANQVIVEVADDGAGIDIDRVRAKAIEQGLVAANEAALLNDAEVLRFIFQPGFSTAQEITEISGRGVGMDVVQSVVHRLKGTVDVDSNPGAGTTFRLRLPLTLAIIRALLFRVEQRLYAIPLNSVVEIARSTESEVHQVDHYEVLKLRNEVLPLVRLGRLPAAQSEISRRKLFVLVITVAERKFGLIVESLEGEEELVIKALDDQAISTDLVSGASIMGDGRVVLILNLIAVIERFSRSRPSVAGTVVAGLLLSHADHGRAGQAATAGGCS